MVKREYFGGLFPPVKKARVISEEMPSFIRRAATRRLMYGKGAMRRGIPRAPRAYAARIHTFRRVGTEQVVTYNGLSGLINGTAAPSTIPTGGGLALSGGTSGAMANSFSMRGAMAFSLSQLGSSGAVTDITNLFDHYRIKTVIVRIDYSGNNAPANVNTPFMAMPLITYAPDFDDAVVTAKDVLLQNGYVKQKRLVSGQSTVYFKINPRSISTAVVGSTAQNVAQGNRNTWLDSSNTQVEHYGLKFNIDDLTNYSGVVGSAGWTVTFTPTYIIEAKSVV